MIATANTSDRNCVSSVIIPTSVFKKRIFSFQAGQFFTPFQANQKFQKEDKDDI